MDPFGVGNESEAREDGPEGEPSPADDGRGGIEFKVPEAMTLIHNEDGRAVSSSAHSAPRDAYFSFLLLRHLRIREMRIKVRRKMVVGLQTRRLYMTLDSLLVHERKGGINCSR